MRMNAKELIAEARVTTPTLPPAAAKLMTAMADRLDVQFVALCESRNEAKQLAGENALMKSAIKTHSESVHFCVGCGKDDPCSNDDVCYALEETPATDAFLAALRAEVEGPLVKALLTIANSEKIDGDTVVCDFDTLVSVASGALSQYYAHQLRSKTEVPS
ncbi:hypothetical protein N7V53_01710 [Kosakonia sp. HypNH10]|uniref:hypothetical protein n=1 Tax=Kosakonia sp. HypNH10 TaxID=2980101 RepID=UPI002448475B|nr:hypothetical protein [Kosakonia sp. HypNH10]MDH2911255.1 hypothetical protein [Kosakonia sp. HypNH10]